MKKLKFSIITFIVSLLVIPLLAQERIDTLTYSKQEVMIPMRVYRLQTWYTGVHGHSIHFYKDIVLKS